MKLEFSRNIFEKLQNSDFMKSRSTGAYCSMRTDGRTDIVKLIVAFRTFAKPPKTNQLYAIRRYSL